MKFAVFLSFFSLMMVLIFTFGKGLENAYYKKSIEQKINQVQLQCNMLANQVYNLNFLIQDSSSTLDVEVDQLASVLEGRIMILDKNFRIIKDTYGFDQNKYFISEDMIRMMRGDTLKSYETKKGYAEVMVPIFDESGKDCQGIVMAFISTEDIAMTQLAIREKSQTLYVIFAILAVSIAWGLSSLLTKPFKVFNEAIRHMADGHLDEKIPVEGYVEMQTMASVINDITAKIQAVEDSRQEFVSNVSHELKTPITSMKVLADSLLSQEGVPAELYREFLVDIAAEIERENKIINDLLALVKMDKKASALNITTVDINELLEMLLKRLRPLAAKRNIEIVFESFRPVSAEIDEVKFSLAFSNLVENAIKYNVDNGWIRVSLNADHKFFYVKIADSGVGIPEDCQDQIFERFYRVDKARSRETGGTGLGLSITRNAILMHKGAIKLYSKEGEGTTFTIRIPLNYVV
ncbi:MAG: two-component sensor histidine kinase [Clostridiales bacterium]|nr:two-component sensor histidine kinase [Clostridiales bacterium]